MLVGPKLITSCVLQHVMLQHQSGLNTSAKSVQEQLLELQPREQDHTFQVKAMCFFQQVAPALADKQFWMFQKEEAKLKEQ